jgi:hypothetical protein
MNTPIFSGLFESTADVIREFHAPIDALDGSELLFAWYEYEDYSGDTFVLFRKDGELYEVNGGHCSCYGLEDQWEPTRTTKDAILMRNNVRPELRALLEEMS